MANDTATVTQTVNSVTVEPPTPSSLTVTETSGGSLTLSDTTVNTHSVTVSPTVATLTIESDFAVKDSPNFTGTPTAPTASAGTNTTQLATTAFVNAAVAQENTLLEMDDVAITSLTNDEILQYNSTTSKWINQTLAEADIASATLLSSHTSSTSNPHSVTASQVGLGNVTNESKATMFTNPVFTGNPTATTQPAANNSTRIASTAYVTTAITNLIDSSPDTLNTLNELAAALNDDANFAGTITTSIATKLPLAGGTMTGNIVMAGSQTVDGRDLSVDGTKLDGIAANANNYVHPSHTQRGLTLASNEVLASFTSDTSGHVTGITKRTLTLANLGYTGATDANNYVHPSHTQRGLTLASNEVLASFTSDTSGHVTGITKRTLTLANLGYTGATDANNYVLPAATDSALGGIKTGYVTNNKQYPVDLDSSSKAFVSVPWTDTVYTLPLAADGTRGGVQIGYTENGKNYPVELSSEKMFVNVPWTDTKHLSLLDDVMLSSVGNGELIVYDSGAWHNKTLTEAGILPLAGGTMTGNIVLNDGVKAIFGTSSDGIELYHASNESYIDDSGTGRLFIRSNGSGVFLQKTDGENLAKFKTDGPVELYHDNSKKFETTGAGATITGDLTASNLFVSNNAALKANGSGYLELGNTNSGVIQVGGDGADSTIAPRFNNLKIQTSRDADDIIFLAGASTTEILRIDASTSSIVASGNLTLSYAYPRINLTDTNNDSDYSIINNDGSFSIYDVTNASHRLSIAANGNATFDKDVTVGGSLILHQAGNFNYISSQDASKDLIIRNTGSGKDIILQVTSSSGTAELFRLRGVTSKEIVSSANFEIRNGTSSRHINLYETYTNSSNYERSFFKHASSFLEIGTEALGTGTASGIKVRTTGVTALSIAAGGLVTVESRNSSSSTNILSVGGSNNGYMSVRHVEGKNSSSNAYGPIYINHLSNNNVFLASGGGGVGIGTTSSLSFKLDVQNSLGGAIARFKDTDSSHDGIRIEGGTGGGIISNASGLSKEALYFQNDLNALRIYTNGGERMRIDSVGRVGIGTTSPSHQFQIHNSGTGSQMNFTDSGSGAADGNGLRVGWNGTYGQVYLFENAKLRLGTNNQERVTILGDGKVGIGTTSPTAQLHVHGSAGSIRVHSSAGGANLYLESQSSSLSRVRWNGVSNFAIRDDADGVDRLTINTDGNTTLAGDLTVQGDISTTGSFTIVDTDVSTTEQLSITNDGTGPALIVNQTGVQPIVDFKDDGTSVFNILNGGDIVMTGDLRLPDGTGASPSLTFSSGLDTGFYRSDYTSSPQKDQVNLSIDGNTKFKVNEAGAWSVGSNIYLANGYQFRTFQEWLATTGGSGYGFKFRNTADSVDCLVISATGNLNPAGNITMADNGKVIATRKLIARDNAGLLLAEDSAATGIFINDSGNTTIQGTLTMASNGTGNSASSQEIIFYGTNSGGSQIDQATIFSTKYHYNTNAGDLVFKTGNTSGTQSERMRINGVGNVGIGTDFPSSKFHLSTSAISQQGTPVTAITKTIATTSIGAKLSFTNAHNANGNLIGGMSMGNTGEEFAGLYAVDGGASAATHLAFFTGNTTATTEAIRILSDGNVGIGVTAPSQKLEVGTNTDVSAQIGRVHVGYFGFGDYAGFAHLDKASTSAYALIQGAAGDTHLNAANGQNLFFRQNHVTVGGFNTSSDFYVDTDTLYVDASTDRVGIGTTSPNAPLSLVGVNGGSWNDGLIIDDPSGWAATVYKRSNSPKMFTGLYTGNDNFIWMSTGYSNSGTTITAPRADAVLMARPSTDDLQIYLETHFGNNVGIATTAPTCKLQVDEYTVGSNGNQDSGIATAAIFTNSGSDGLYLGVKNASYPNRGYAFKVTSNGVNSDFTIKEHGLSGDRFKIFTGGKIEQNYISYTDSSNYEALQISGESDHIRFTSKTVGSFASNNRNFKFYQNGSIRAEISPNGVTAYSTFYISSGGAFRAYGHDSIISTGGGDYDIKFNLNDLEKVRFKANGNVGIGNTNPTQAKLQVSGGSVLIDAYNATGTHGLFFRSGFVTSNQYNLSITCHNDGDGSSDALDINAYDGIYFNTGAGTRNNRAFINSSGKFCINQTDTSSDYLQVTGANGLYAARFNGSSTGGNSYGLRVRAGTNENDISFIAENTSGVDLFRVSGNGNVAIGNVTPTSKLYIHSGAFSSGEGEIRNDARVNRNYKLALGTTTKYIGTVQMNGNGDSSGFHVRIYDGHSKVWREVNVVIQNSGGTNFPKVTVEGGGDDVNINVEFAYVNRSGAAQKTDFYLVPTVNKTYTQLIFVDGYIERDTGHSSTSSTNINLDTAVGIYKAATDDSSKIGIGTVDPDQKLHIKGDALRIEESASVTGRHLDIIPAVSGQPHKFTSTSTGSGYHFENSNGLIASFEEANTNFHQNVDITSGDLFFNTNGKGLHFDGVGNWDFRMRTLDSGSGNVPLIFESQNGNSSSPVERFRINSNGNALFSQNLTVNGTFEVSTLATPNAPTNLSLSVVGETINVTFTASTTSNIDSYLVYSSVDGGDYGLISIIPPEDFGSTMSIIDSAFAVTGTQAYRVYAVKAGKLSSALTGNISYTVSSAEPTNLSVVALNNAFYIQYDPPSSNSRFVTAYKIFKHEHATQNSLDRTQASEIYSGMNKSYMYQISGSNNTNFHQFWVETTIAT